MKHHQMRVVVDLHRTSTPAASLFDVILRAVGLEQTTHQPRVDIHALLRL